MDALSISKALESLKGLLPKKSVPDTYVQMLRVAAIFAEAEVNDIMKNRKAKNMPVNVEELYNLFNKRYEFHINNQIELFKSQK